VLRIRKTRWKVAYFAVFLVIANVVTNVLWPRVPLWVASLTGSLLMILVIGVAVRSFRGRGEAIAPPRPWWRMTARPTAGFVLGSFYIVSVVWSVASAIIEPPDMAPLWVGSVIPLAVGALFFNSSIRLVRDPPPTVPEPAQVPKWKPIKP